MSGLNSTLTNLENIAELNAQINALAQASALAQAQAAFILAQIEAEGIQAQLALNQRISALNVESDIAGIATRGTLLLASKALEQSVLIAQFREKMLGLFTTIMEQRSNNTWNRIKTLSQGFKF